MIALVLAHQQHTLQQIRNIGSVIRNNEKAAAATQALGSGWNREKKRENVGALLL